MCALGSCRDQCAVLSPGITIVDITKPLVDCYWTMRLYFNANRVAESVVPELRHSACKQFGVKYVVRAERDAYIESRAAQLAQPLVDDILRANPNIPSRFGNKLVLSAAGKAAILVTKSERRRAA
jgi:hypothetical protein